MTLNGLVGLIARRLYASSSSWSSFLSSWSCWSPSVRSARYAQVAPAYWVSNVKCKKPFRAGLVEAGCGQCLPCRINRQRLWTIRLLLEAGQHEHSLFGTFTYDESNLPADGSVSVREAQLLLKAIRRTCGRVRYFIVGEYGEVNWRPHYHAILFGLRDRCRLDRAWSKGFVHVSGVGPESISYVAGYCLKGGTTESGMRWLKRPELRPEFARMSLRPGIGALAADRIGSYLCSSSAVALHQLSVPTVVRQSRKKWPLGRYLRSRIAAEIGIDADRVSQVRQLQDAVELRLMDQGMLNARLKKSIGKAERSGFLAEERYKRKSLERKL